MLSSPIKAGAKGQVSIGDTVWPVAGPEMPAGARVRVTDAQGTALVVEPVGGSTDG